MKLFSFPTRWQVLRTVCFKRLQLPPFNNRRLLRLSLQEGRLEHRADTAGKSASRTGTQRRTGTCSSLGFFWRGNVADFAGDSWTEVLFVFLPDNCMFHLTPRPFKPSSSSASSLRSCWSSMERKSLVGVSVCVIFWVLTQSHGRFVSAMVK